MCLSLPKSTKALTQFDPQPFGQTSVRGAPERCQATRDFAALRSAHAKVWCIGRRSCVPTSCEVRAVSKLDAGQQQMPCLTGDYDRPLLWVWLVLMLLPWTILNSDSQILLYLECCVWSPQAPLPSASYSTEIVCMEYAGGFDGATAFMASCHSELHLISS